MQIQFKDREMKCTVCGAIYDFTAVEQQYYLRKALEEPKRCKACRKLKRKEYAERRKRLIRSLTASEVVKLQVSTTPAISSKAKAEENANVGIVPSSSNSEEKNRRK